MNNLDTELFGDVASPSSVNQILDLAREHSGERKNVHLWRGQGDIKWPIHSSGYRRLRRNQEIVSEQRMQSYEKYLLEHATHQGYRYENSRKLSDFELLAKLQHHGAATRLIDCSRNILVSLWFSCISEPNSTGVLFGVHSNHLGGGENEPESRDYDGVFSELEGFSHPQTWQPPVVSKRIAAQRAQFLYSVVQEGKFGSLAIENDSKSYIAIAITPEFKKSALLDLSDYFDIRHLTMFPDIDGFGYANSYNFDKFESERW